MRVIVISCVYLPEPIVSAQTSSQVSDALLKHNHIVRVITAFPNRPEGKLYPGYYRKVYAKSILSERHCIIRCFSTFSQNSSISSRFLENISFGITSGLALLFSKKPDVIYANTWPIFAQGILMLVCKLRRVPLVLSVQDLYPESLFLQKRGFKRKSRLYAILRWLDAQIARNCARLIVISEQFKEVYITDRRISENKITVIPNWIDDSQIAETSPCENIREKHNIPADAFLLVFGGNIGVASGVEHLVNAFQYLISQENIYLLLAGAGSSLPYCIGLVQKHQLGRIKIHSPWQTSDTYAVLSAADLCILPTQGKQSMTSVPSKLITYLLSGRPVLALALPKSETTQIVDESGCGWVIDPDQPEQLARKIEEISKISEDRLLKMGKSGREHALKNFVSEVCLPKVIDVILSTAVNAKLI